MFEHSPTKSPNNATYAILGGWANGAARYTSPNADARPPDLNVDLLVIHAISLPPNEFGGGYVNDLFLNKLETDKHAYFQEIEGLRVSSHFFITRQGHLTQFVSTDDRAWHCGESNFCGRSRCNDFSVGIELEGCDTQPFETQQYETLVKLTKALCDAYPALSNERVVGHSDIAPGRKTDPGPYFDWKRYRKLMGW